MPPPPPPPATTLCNREGRGEDTGWCLWRRGFHCAQGRGVTHTQGLPVRVGTAPAWLCHSAHSPSCRPRAGRGPHPHSPSAGAGSHVVLVGVRAEAAGPCGFCAEPRPGHLGRPEAGAGRPRTGGGDPSARPRGHRTAGETGQGPVLEIPGPRGPLTREKLSPRKGRGSQPLRF